jgi:hypothetical protein
VELQRGPHAPLQWWIVTDLVPAPLVYKNLSDEYGLATDDIAWEDAVFTNGASNDCTLPNANTVRVGFLENGPQTPAPRHQPAIF